MLLKKISYHNFRPFIGDQSINLDVSTNGRSKNVIVLLGDNTFGKSTIVLSFIWCLYGESRFTKSEDILNKKVEGQMSFGDQETAMVELQFEDGGIQYTMTRTQTFTMGTNGKLSTNGSIAKLTYVKKDGQTKTLGKMQNEVMETISAILPKELANFFFFEGEKNNEIKKKALGKAVRTLLGLEAFEKMKLHLHGSGDTFNTDSVMGRYAQLIGKNSDTKTQDVLNQKQAAEAELESVNTRIAELQSDIASYEDRIESINQQLRLAAPSKELQRRRDAIRIELQEAEKKLIKKMEKFISLASKASLPLLILPMLDSAQSRLEKMDIADKGIKGIEATAIKELLSRGVCLCGTDLREGTLAYKNVAQYIDFIPPKNVGTLAREMFDKISETKEQASIFVSDFEELYREIQQIKLEIDSLEREEREKLAEIAKIAVVDTSIAESNLSLYKSRITELNQELSSKQNRSGQLTNLISSLTAQFNTLQAKNLSAQKYQLYFNYAEALYKWLDKNYSMKENEMRERLNDLIQSVFNNMFSGEREIFIDEDYNIRLTYRGVVVDDTGGLRVIQYFSYIGALVKLAFEVMKERKKGQDSFSEGLGEQYPLVLDAAFSHADETHTKNIASTLSSAAHQLVFAVMQKDWQHAKTGLAGKIARIYELKKIDEIEVQIIEVK